MRKYINEGLQGYINDTNIPWHMPGHKRKGFDGIREACDIDEVISGVYHMDVTEVYGLDDLHLPEQMIYQSERELAKVYKTYASYYLVNGATSGMLTAVAACAGSGDKIIMARNCHKSASNIAQLLKLEVLYFEPDKLTVNDSQEASIYGAIDIASLNRLCEEASDAKAIVVTSPTYEGIVPDIKAVSEIAHSYDMKLIVDEAHGAHLPFMETGCRSAIYCGADIVVQSLHKTLPAMTQTAVIHVINEALDEAVRKYKSIFMSSSPSYVLMCSMEQAVAWACHNDYTDYMIRLRNFRKKAGRLHNITLLDGQDKCGYDITRLVFISETTGEFMEAWLRCNKNIICEMSGPDYVVLISSAFDSEADFDYLYEALCELDKACGPCDAYRTEGACDYSGLLGTVASDNIYVYPPGHYIVAKGELINEQHIKQLNMYAKTNKRIINAPTDSSFSN